MPHIYRTKCTLKIKTNEGLHCTIFQRPCILRCKGCLINPPLNICFIHYGHSEKLYVTTASLSFKHLCNKNCDNSSALSSVRPRRITAINMKAILLKLYYLTYQIKFLSNKNNEVKRESIQIPLYLLWNTLCLYVLIRTRFFLP
jgi:hypothetical protein